MPLSRYNYRVTETPKVFLGEITSQNETGETFVKGTLGTSQLLMCARGKGALQRRHYNSISHYARTGIDCALVFAVKTEAKTPLYFSGMCVSGSITQAPQIIYNSTFVMFLPVRFNINLVFRYTPL